MAWIRSDSSENMVLAVERRLTQLAAKSTPGTVRRDSTQSSPARKVRITTVIDNERMELAEERRRLNEAMAAHAVMMANIPTMPVGAAAGAAPAVYTGGLPPPGMPMFGVHAARATSEFEFDSDSDVS